MHAVDGAASPFDGFIQRNQIFFGVDGDKRNIFLNQVLQLFIYDKPFVLIDFLHAKRYVGNNTGLAIGACLGGLIASISFPLTYAVTSMPTFAFAVFLFFFMTFSAQDEIPAENAAAAHAKSESPLRDLTRFHIYLFLDSARCFIICHLRSGATSSRLI